MKGFNQVLDLRENLAFVRLLVMIEVYLPNRKHVQPIWENPIL